MKFLANITEEDTKFQELIREIKTAESLALIILTALRLAFAFTVKIVEAELTERAQRPTDWPNCPECGRRLRSKGFLERGIKSIIGEIHWKRRIGRCPSHCHIGQIAPLDEQLGLFPYQSTSIELCHLACLLAVFVPYETAAIILGKFLPIYVSAMTIWTWVQEYGKLAILKLDHELSNLEQGIMPTIETITQALLDLPLIIGADGVKAPFRPFEGSPIGKISWKEVKVAILARLGKRIKRNGEAVSKLEQRRLVAVLGSVDILRPRLWLEALRQGILETKDVVWVSDGGPGFWNLFTACFTSLAIGILDFYHAAQNLWKGAAAWLDGRTKKAQEWFSKARHLLRQGQLDMILIDITQAMLSGLPSEVWRILDNLYEYLSSHRAHLHYPLFKEGMGLPIGSGIVESACKWLIQQRFKGVGMRWSENGFNNLLHLRLAWVNGRFDELFFPNSHSPN